MSYIPLHKFPSGPIRNRQWRNTTLGTPGQRYLAPCTGVSDDGYQILHDCTADAGVVNTPTDLCGKPFRTGSVYVEQTATGSQDQNCGRPFRT